MKGNGYPRTAGLSTRSTQRSYSSLEERDLDEAFAVRNPTGYSLRCRPANGKNKPKTVSESAAGDKKDPLVNKKKTIKKEGRPTRARSASAAHSKKSTKVSSSKRSTTSVPSSSGPKASDSDDEYDNLSEGRRPKTRKANNKRPIVLPRAKSLPPSSQWKDMQKPYVDLLNEPDSDGEAQPDKKEANTRTNKKEKPSKKKSGTKDSKVNEGRKSKK